MTFGAKLYELRTARGLSQKQLADAAGLAQTAVGHWESGQRDPSWANVMKLCAALGVTCVEFADCEPGGAPASDRRGPGRPAGGEVTPPPAGKKGKKSS